jgi:hypothetical protein
MMKPVTLQDLFAHTYEELKAEGLIESEEDMQSPQPDTQVIKTIMNYSKALSVHTYSSIGSVTYLMN